MRYLPLLLLLCLSQIVCSRERTTEPPVVPMDPKLFGLDRVYFQQVLDLSREPIVDSLLPMQVKDTTLIPKQYLLPEEMTVRDFWFGGRATRIRQVVNYNNPRMAETWWALYAGRERTCLWRFRAFSSELDHKALSNYVIDSVYRTGEKNVIIRVWGEMFRPGWWWITGKVFAFSEVDSGFAFSYVENAFGFFSDRSFTVSTEELAGDHFVIRETKDVPNALLRGCGFRFSEMALEPEEPEPTWDERCKAARCITKNAIPTTRALHEPSFVERGGK